jgi:hypothetical protein
VPSQANLEISLKDRDRIVLRRVEIAGLFVALLSVVFADIIGPEFKSLAQLIAALVIVTDGSAVVLQYRPGTPA